MPNDSTTIEEVDTIAGETNVADTEKRETDLSFISKFTPHEVISRIGFFDKYSRKLYPDEESKATYERYCESLESSRSTITVKFPGNAYLYLKDDSCLDFSEGLINPKLILPIELEQAAKTEKGNVGYNSERLLAGLWISDVDNNGIGPNDVVLVRYVNDMVNPPVLTVLRMAKNEANTLKNKLEEVVFGKSPFPTPKNEPSLEKRNQESELSYVLDISPNQMLSRMYVPTEDVSHGVLLNQEAVSDYKDCCEKLSKEQPRKLLFPDGAMRYLNQFGYLDAQSNWDITNGFVNTRVLIPDEEALEKGYRKPGYDVQRLLLGL